ncbi:helix-turn-helix transcriptional regulator [Micromonospora endolithica]|nr:helix-turn-helix transcriptional regulator [Micromonospora endolithica]
MLLGRDDELAQLMTLLHKSSAGHGQTVVVRGPLASGRTELLHAFGERAVEAGAVLLTATAAHAERALPAGLIGQLVRSTTLPAHLDERVADVMDLDVAAETPPEDTRTFRRVLGESDARRIHGLCAVLLELGRDRPLVISIDDIQYADEASLQVLLYLRRRMRRARVMLVLSEWQRPQLARPPLRAELTRQPQRRLVLGLLSAATTADAVARALGTEPKPAFTAACHRLTGGNPLLLHALIADNVEDGRGTEGSAAPVLGPAFREAVLDCLHRWEPEFLQVGRALAVLGERATAELVAQLLGLRRHVVVEVLDALTAAGVTTGCRYNAPVTGTVVLEAEPAEMVSYLHVRAAEVLHGHGVNVVDVARHVIAAGEVPGDWAVPILRQAADQTIGQDAALAMTSLKLAVRTCDDDGARVPFHAALVRAAWQVNPSAATPHLTLLHDALDAGELTHSDAAPVIRHALWQGDLSGAMSRLSGLRAPASTADHRAEAELRLSISWIFGHGRAKAYDEVRRRKATPATPAAPGLLALGRLGAMWTDGATKEVVTAADHVLESRLDTVVPEVAAAAIFALIYADRLTRAGYWCDVLFEEAVRRGATTWQAVLGAVRAEIALRRGGLSVAAAHGRTALARLPAQGWGVLIGFPLSVVIRAEAAMGHHDEAAALLDRPVPRAMYDSVFGAWYLNAAGQHNLAIGRALAGLDDFERCATIVRRCGADLPLMMPWRSDVARAQLRLGGRKRARDLLTEQLGRPGEKVGLRARGASLRLLAASVDLKDRMGILREAIQLLERCGDRLELAQALADMGQVYRELGELGRARLVLRRAGRAAKELTADVGIADFGTELLDQARIDLNDEQNRAPSGGVPDEPMGVSVAVDPQPDATSEDEKLTALSDAERRVAMLAAGGHTNREISRKLFITVSTVEQHLTRVYRKLNVTRRTDLPADLSRQSHCVVGFVGR